MTPDHNPSGVTSPSQTTGSTPRHRPLNEDVLQSAEEALASEGASQSADDYAGLSRGDYVSAGPAGMGSVQAGGVQSPYTGRLTSGESSWEGVDGTAQSDRESSLGFFSRMESKITRYVAAEPAKAAMMAAGAGVLLAMVLGRARSGRSERSGWR